MCPFILCTVYKTLYCQFRATALESHKCELPIVWNCSQTPLKVWSLIQMPFPLDRCLLRLAGSVLVRALKLLTLYLTARPWQWKKWKQHQGENIPLILYGFCCGVLKLVNQHFGMLTVCDHPFEFIVSAFHDWFQQVRWDFMAPKSAFPTSCYCTDHSQLSKILCFIK